MTRRAAAGAGLLASAVLLGAAANDGHAAHRAVASRSAV